MARKPKEGGVRLKTIGIRVNDKQRYGLELLTRRYRQSISEVVSSAIDSAINEGLTVDLQEFYKTYFLQYQSPDVAGAYALDTINYMKNRIGEITDANIFNALWDPEEADRVIRLGTFWPALLDYPIEELAWKIIQEDKYHEDSKYWCGTDGNIPNYKKIREDWEKIKKQAEERAK